MRNQVASIDLPELEEPVCCLKVQDLAQGVLETTIGYLPEDDLGQRMGTYDQPWS